MSETSVSQVRARPLAIPRPKLREGESITNQILEERAFYHAYFKEKTGIEIPHYRNKDAAFYFGRLVLTYMKDCARSASIENQANLDPYIARFSDQGEPAIQQTYSIFLRRLEDLYQSSSMSPEYYSLILDMLVSTENSENAKVGDKLWLYKWANLEEEKRVKKLQARISARRNKLTPDLESEPAVISEPASSSSAFSGTSRAQSQLAIPQFEEKTVGERVRQEGVDARDGGMIIEAMDSHHCAAKRENSDGLSAIYYHPNSFFMCPPVGETVLSAFDFGNSYSNLRS
ncbi:hypothetical protein TWF102_008077 [Orbilia oligospora]|uniref:Uncharacterized protein n=1 Tax=Orbilia oligospora TaxID=2813651 RepID=A0A7C8JFH3_ORBOL|nr:hypothetical protein TWF102_008077 [Orbilia oligospora]